MVKIFNFLKKYWPLIGLIIISGFTYYFLLKELRKVPMPEISEFPVPPQKVHCLVLDKEYCEKGELVYDKDNNFVGLGFTLPDETKIYAPFDGSMDIHYAEVVFPNQTHEGFYIEKREGEKIFSLTVVGAPEIILKPEPEERLIQVEKGQLIAKVDKSLNRKIILPEGTKDYDILINIWQFDLEEGWFRNKNELQKFFNYIK